MENKLTDARVAELLDLLEARFNKNKERLANVDFSDVKAKLMTNLDKLASLNEMELSGGEPELVWLDEETNEFVFVDCSKETPTGRRNCCYDDEALESRKKFKPDYSAVGLANKMGIELITEEEYRKLQEFKELDLKTSSWIKTPEKIRKLGGALFCDRRYDTVFLYHNGAESYYSVRSFRGKLKV